MDSVREYRGLRPCGRCCLAAVLLWTGLPVLSLAADVNKQASYLLAPVEEALWLVRADAEQSSSRQRGLSGPFTQRPELLARIVEVAARADQMLAFTSEGDIYTLDEAGWSVELALPGRALPAAVAFVEDDLYALLEAETSSLLPMPGPEGESPTTRPFDPRNSPLAVARYDHQRWVALARCPAEITLGSRPGMGPRLLSIGGGAYLFWCSADGETVRSLCLESERWVPGLPDQRVESLKAFWPATLSRIPVLVVAVPGDDGQEQIRVYRLLGRAGAADATWREVTLNLSALPEAAGAGVCVTAGGFNQHLALLVHGGDGASYLRFARADAPPVEASVRVDDEFRAGSSQVPPLVVWLHSATLAVLAGILLGLLLVRRATGSRMVQLPGGWTTAMALQRLLAGLIDLVPFAAAFSLALGVNAEAGLRELVGWAAGGDAVKGHLPASRTLLWWAASTGACSAYCLLMELILGRTVGKLVLGTRVLAAAGTKAAVWQVLLRNAFRWLELQPPLWILGFLVVVSRYRQRVGDVFAGTMVVRRESPPAPDEPGD